MILSLALLGALAGDTLKLTPTDDVWVYPHASDPAGDAVIRVWGTGGISVPKSSGDAPEFSFGYMKWDLKDVPVGAKLSGAKLVVHQVAKPGYTLDQAKVAPLEARPVGTGFGEKGWVYESLGDLLPSAGRDEVFGTGAPVDVGAETLPIEIDLLRGPAAFRVEFQKSLDNPSKEIALALVSALDMSALGRAGIYKIYSKDEKQESLRPALVLTFEK